MSYVAFDLDNTLGYFEVVGPLAFLMSPEFLENPEESSKNSLKLSKGLKLKLKNVRKEFAEKLLKTPHVLPAVLRPNLDLLIKPLLKKKPTVIIYSNTGNAFSTHLARDMIEHKYRSPGLIQLIADVFHPLRESEIIGAGGDANGYMNPEKTYPVLVALLKAAAKSSAPIHPDQILFVDDKTPMHPISEAITWGLTYIKPTPYAPRVNRTVRREILEIALDILDKAGLLSDEEYLSSGICFRRIYRSEGTTVIRGFPDLLSYVWKSMNETYYPPRKWLDDTPSLKIGIRQFCQLRER